MSEPYGYARQKLWESLHALVGHENIKDRLGAAYSLLLLLRPDQDFPEDLRETFQALMFDLNKRVVHFSYRSSRINTRGRKASHMAETILRLYIELRGGI